MAPKQPTNTEQLLAQLIEKLEQHTDNLDAGQDKLSDRFDTLSRTYTELASRLAHVEAKDFNSVINKIDVSQQKIFSLEKLNSGLEEKLDSMTEDIVSLREKTSEIFAKIERIHFYINVVTFVFASVLTPILVAWVSKILFNNQ